jgi:hypothetical protein
MLQYFCPGGQLHGEFEASAKDAPGFGVFSQNLLESRTSGGYHEPHEHGFRIAREQAVAGLGKIRRVS